jgi:exonuclease III
MVDRLKLLRICIINTIDFFTLCKNINFVGKGVDKYNPVLPKSMPRGYGGVTIIWRENIDHLIRILPDGAERIQCEEINSNNDTKFLVASVYLPSKGSHVYLSTPFPTKLMFYSSRQLC